MKKSYIVLFIIIIFSVVATQFTDTDQAVTTATSYVVDAADSVSEAPEPETSEPEASATESVDDSDHSWGNPNTLHDHYKRHGPDFDARDAQDYARQAHEFYENRAQYQIKKQDGVTRVYDSETNTFGAYNANGTTRTFYKPTDGQAYFDRQPGE